MRARLPGPKTTLEECEVYVKSNIESSLTVIVLSFASPKVARYGVT